MIGVPEALIREFSQRRDMIEAGRTSWWPSSSPSTAGSPPRSRSCVSPSRRTWRPARTKQHRSLAGHVRRAGGNGPSSTSARSRWRGCPRLRDRNDLPLLRADDLTDEMLAEVAELAVEWQAERRATFSRANIIAEVARQLEGSRSPPLTIGWR